MTIKILISALCLIMCIYLTIKTSIQINKVDKDIKRTDETIEQLRQESIKALEQEPKRGKWVQAKDIEKEYAICTNCKHHGEFYMDYCPNCGARMETEQ